MRGLVSHYVILCFFCRNNHSFLSRPLTVRYLLSFRERMEDIKCSRDWRWWGRLGAVGLGRRAWNQRLGVGPLKGLWVVDLFRAVQQCLGSQDRAQCSFEPSFHLHHSGRLEHASLSHTREISYFSLNSRRKQKEERVDWLLSESRISAHFFDSPL